MLTLLQLLNTAAPIVANVIVAIKNNTGGTSALVYLDQTDADFASNQAQVSAWLAAHGKSTVNPTTPATPPAA